VYRTRNRSWQDLSLSQVAFTIPRVPISQIPSITEHRRALRLFTDRFPERREFVRSLHRDPPPERILFFYGDGGNGKSLLLKLLQSYYCTRLPADAWLQLDDHDDDRRCIAELDRVKANGVAVPCIYHDFDRESDAEQSPREGWAALMMLRRRLGAVGIKLPSFDFAVLRYLLAGRQWSPELIKPLFPTEEGDLVGSVVDALVTNPGQIPVMGTAVKALTLLDRHFKTRAAMWRAERGLDDDVLQKISTLDPNTDLLDELPHLFGRDLNAAMKERDRAALRNQQPPARLVLMFDSYEAFWGTERHHHSTQSYFQRDEWLRRLLCELYRPNAGVIVVVSGRELPRWSEAPSHLIPSVLVHAMPIGHLSRNDAFEYLTSAFTPLALDADAAPVLKEKLIDYSEVERDQVHPLYLGLAADVVLAAHERGQVVTGESFADEPTHARRGRILAARLLKCCSMEVEYAVKALAATRGFDRSLFSDLGKELRFEATDAAFETLTHFSFVRRDALRLVVEYRIHALLSRVLCELDVERTREAHVALEKIYRARAVSEPGAIVEAIYHANRLDWERGLKEWDKACEAAMRLAQYDLCEALIRLRPALRIETDFWLAVTAYRNGEVAWLLSRYELADACFKDAIAAFDAGLAKGLDLVAAYNRKGNALWRWGVLRLSLNDHAGAQQAYQEAIAAHDVSLALAPDQHLVCNDKGNALCRLGEVRQFFEDHVGAQEAYEQSIAAYDATLVLKPDYAVGHSNKGHTLWLLGELLAQLSHTADALRVYERAIASLDAALALAPDLLMAHNNRGIALWSLGTLQATLGESSVAEQTYDRAIAALDAALARGPDLRTLMNKGDLLDGMSGLRAKSGDYLAAQKAAEEAIATYNRVLARVPDHAYALAARSRCLGTLEEYQRRRSG
jgi:tetratricopeptide (TPR) repeat protein